MKLIQRDMYLNRLQSVMGTPDIKVITGVRRSGKSKLMEAFAAMISQSNPSTNIIHLNLTLPENESLLEYHALYDYVNGKYQPGKDNILMVDEFRRYNIAVPENAVKGSAERFYKSAQISS